MSKYSKMHKILPFNKVREAVSGDRRRHQGNGYDLDLTYIEDNIIAMSFPAAGIEAAWRNHIDHVVNFLKKAHGQNFMIWNLSERTYDFDKFDNQILHLPFPDHHPPPLTRLFQIVQTTDNWIRADKRNVCVIHCVGGKGRTGTVISACLFFSGKYSTINDAIEHFARQRSAAGRGVTQPSQRRYIQYFAKVLTQMKPVRLTEIRLVHVAVGPVSANKEYGLEVYDSPYLGKLLYMSYPGPSALLNFNINIDVKGDIYIKFTEKSAKHTKKDRFFIVMHASFVSQKHYHFNKRNLDTLEFDKKFADNLSVGIKFGPPQSPSAEPEVDKVIETMRNRYLEEKSNERERSSYVHGNGVEQPAMSVNYVDPPPFAREETELPPDSWSRAKPKKRADIGPPLPTKLISVNSTSDLLANANVSRDPPLLDAIEQDERDFNEPSQPLNPPQNSFAAAQYNNMPNQRNSPTRDRSNGYSHNKSVAYPVPLDTFSTALQKIETHKRRLSQLNSDRPDMSGTRSNDAQTTTGGVKNNSASRRQMTKSSQYDSAIKARPSGALRSSSPATRAKSTQISPKKKEMATRVPPSSGRVATNRNTAQISVAGTPKGNAKTPRSQTPSSHYVQLSEQLQAKQKAVGAGKQSRAARIAALPKAQVLYNFKAKYPEEISMRRGDVVRITSRAYENWWFGYVQGQDALAVTKTGYFPSKYVQILDA